MRNKRLFSILLTVAFLVGSLTNAGLSTEKANAAESGKFKKTEAYYEDKVAKSAPSIDQGDIDSLYPYRHLEEPATIEGLDFRLKDDVEFLPDDVSYSIEDAPIASYTDETVTGQGKPTITPKSRGGLSVADKTYQPGTNMLDFCDSSFIPEKNKIYIDEDNQCSYKIVDDVISGASGIKVPVVKPRASDVFESIYIPRQEIRLTNGNITDMAEGVTLVDDTKVINSYAANTTALPDPDTSRKYHEFNIPEILLYEYPSKSGKKPVETEQPKGKENKPTQKPTPTPHPEDRDAKDTQGKSTSISIKLKGGKIRVYEPRLICEADWTGDFDLGFRAMKVESNILVESKISFEKEMCIRLYGYGVDFDSGATILGRRIAAHIGIGIYAVIGVNGEISILAKAEQVGNINGGVKGNFWGILVGVPSALPYAGYESEKFNSSILLNGKIHAWAYIGPQLTLDVLDFNLLTAQVWLGLEADAVIQAEANTSGEASMQIDLSADFVAVFRAWLFDNPYENYLLKLNIFKKTMQYKTGSMVGGDSELHKKIIPVIQVDGACAFRDVLWGSIWYEHELAGTTMVPNIPINIGVTRGGKRYVYPMLTDSDGCFVFKPNEGLRPTDSIDISVDCKVAKGDGSISYKSKTLVPIHPTIPFQPYILEADAFNDLVSGTISPCKIPLPGYPEEENYDGIINIMVFDEEGTLIRRKQIETSDGFFGAKFSDTMDLSGGHSVKASISFEGGTVETELVRANLDNLNIISDCLVDGVDAATIEDYQRERQGQIGIGAREIEAMGTITNIKNSRPFGGDIRISVSYPFGMGGWSEDIPLVLHAKELKTASLKHNGINSFATKPKLDEKFLQSSLLPTSTFSVEVGQDVLGEQGRLISGISLEIEHEGIIKRVNYNFGYNNPIVASTQAGTIDKIMIETIDSKVNWPDIMITAGQSNMWVGGFERSIDGRGNTSVMVVEKKVYVPIEALIQALGGTVSYGSDQKITISINGKTVSCKNGERNIVIGKTQSSLDAAPFMSSNGTMMFPMTFLTRNLGLITEWSADTGTLSVWSSAK